MYLFVNLSILFHQFRIKILEANTESEMAKKMIFAFLLFTVSVVYGQSVDDTKRIDSLLNITTSKPFNGVIVISQNRKDRYLGVYGYSDIEKKVPLQISDQFVIGSISKQITAVIVLREYEKGNLNLDVPIRKYLPELWQDWADTVTIHHLLTHMHGIVEPDKPTAFKAGTQFNYAHSSLGYDLLSKIVERTSGKSFVELSKKLFAKCKMKHTFHPENNEYINLVKGYTEQEYGRLAFDTTSLRNPAAAGTFISTAHDMVLWNKCLHGGTLLKKETYKLMTTKQQGAVRNHPVFGKTEYGYGITVDTEDNLLQLGQTGLVDGFASMNFYFPKTKTSAIVLENTVYDRTDLNKSFLFHTKILSIVRENCLIK